MVLPQWKAMDLFKEALANWARSCLPMILSRQTRPAPGKWDLIRYEFGISLRGAISWASFASTVSGCWRNEWEHRRARFPYCQNFAISSQRRARGRTFDESLDAVQRRP